MLKLVGGSEKPKAAPQGAVQDHISLLSAYFQSHRIRNHSPTTLAMEKRFLNGWFESHGADGSPLYTWEAMTPVTGRDRIVAYGQALIESGVRSETARSYLGMLRRYFSFVLEHPFIPQATPPRRIQEAYGPIDQPVSEYDMPHHVYQGERLGVPIDPEKIYEFYAVIRREYLDRPGSCRSIRARNYTMAVLAGETGLRIDELMNLDWSRDLFFDSHKLQTRFAKATRGSGKRSRVTLFPPLARDTVRFYLKAHRSEILGPKECEYLFPSKTGRLVGYAPLQDALRKMIKGAQNAGFPVANHMSWHWFRRIFATRFIERFPERMEVLVTVLGHMSPNTVHRYIRHSEAWMDKQLQAVLEDTTQWPSIGN